MSDREAQPTTALPDDLQALQQQFGAQVVACRMAIDCPEAVVERSAIVEICHFLRGRLGYDQLIDICGVDMSEHPDHQPDQPRFEVVYHLLSVSDHKRIRIKTRLDEREFVDSVTEVWPAADWFEREAFDMFGIIFNHHPDLRRILTDYGFEGYPLRKDFPVTGRVELFYDEEERRCVYRPIALENRVLTPKAWPEEHLRG
ncbi:MAG: NADH-quinone oxidoreductase subunit C [Zetaproteobacteria bacterium]|nr:MAG: NADH-quinone oxidoreductase subunit C [Zetaproteobacteria bacterium]